MKYLTMILGSLLVIMAIWAGTFPNVLASDEIVGGCTWCLEKSVECWDLRAGCTGDFPCCFQVKYETGDQSECSPVGFPCTGPPAFNCDDYDPGYMCGC